ncbi:MAG: hypothetical protein KAX13_11235 [Candidatus Krumholzibacteria bacterium]|nr:hypothetical protein [Candidatus Krumholzibacteria bacterium]
MREVILGQHFKLTCWAIIVKSAIVLMIVQQVNADTDSKIVHSGDDGQNVKPC